MLISSSLFFSLSLIINFYARQGKYIILFVSIEFYKLIFYYFYRIFFWNKTTKKHIFFL